MPRNSANRTFRVRIDRDRDGHPVLRVSSRVPEDAFGTESCGVQHNPAVAQSPAAEFPQAPLEDLSCINRTTGAVIQQHDENRDDGSIVTYLADGPIARDARWKAFQRYDRAVEIRADGLVVLWTRSYRGHPCNNSDPNAFGANPARHADGTPLRVLGPRDIVQRTPDGETATAQNVSLREHVWHPELVVEHPDAGVSSAREPADLFWNVLNPMLADPFLTDDDLDALSAGEDHRTEEHNVDGIPNALATVAATNAQLDSKVTYVVAVVEFASPSKPGSVKKISFRNEDDPHFIMRNLKTREEIDPAVQERAAALLPLAYRVRRNAQPDTENEPLSPRQSDFFHVAETIQPIRRTPSAHEVAAAHHMLRPT